MVGGKDSKLNISFHGNIRIPSPLPSGLTRSHECRQKVGDSVGVLIAVRNVLNTEAHKIKFPDRSLIQFPWGMHICDYDEEKKKKENVAGPNRYCGCLRQPTELLRLVPMFVRKRAVCVVFRKDQI